ncbi:3-beta hydroxysteroid dehydrogenase [Prosthecochloris sp. GSB1]|uniref:SDR family oxidoreductase n=1 Tax=Prosthecochloris sp. GSB1 TaxID=281093 RepID=UPI000B8C8EEA|nr:SDR family oxidoreductase [Prosthecochloris sp. GSB1]ASQ90453.1 3-beta hydroxysteroid dehydrogenase [Prosthecochloris sp. GSB1]
MKNVLVAGGSGYLGRYVAREFKKRGNRVRVLVRNPEKIMNPGEHGEPVLQGFVDEVISGDATRPETIRGLCEGMDIVFSSLGMTRPDFRHSSFDVDYMGNRRILDMALETGVKKFIYVSVFNAEKMLDISNIQAHEQFAGELRKSGMNYTIVRPTGYFSDMGQFLNIVKSGVMPILGEGDKRSNPIHAEDLAKVCVDAAGNDLTDIDAGGPDVFTYRELAELAAETAGKTPLYVEVPLWIADVLLPVAKLVNRDIADIIAFTAAVGRLDGVAPRHGTRRLKDYFRECLSAEG